MNDDHPTLERVPLAEPRPLTPLERSLIDFLLDGPLGREELRAQAATATVGALCSCGCPSVYLAVDRSLPAVRFLAEEVLNGRTDVVSIAAGQRRSRRPAEVTLHVCDGYLEELEIWAGEFGVRPRVDSAKLERVD